MDVRYALLLHGRVGAWDQSPTQSLHARGGPRKASRRLIRFCAETHLAHIVRAVGAPVDVFIHTWHPELATFIDGIYGEALRGSQHEPVRSKLPKAQSQALSIGKVAALALSHGSIAKLALVLRLDLAVLEPPRLDLFSPAAATTAQWCCLGSARSSLQVQAAVQAACGAADLQLRSSEPCERALEAARISAMHGLANSWAKPAHGRQEHKRRRRARLARPMDCRTACSPATLARAGLTIWLGIGAPAIRADALEPHRPLPLVPRGMAAVAATAERKLAFPPMAHYTWALRFAVGMVARAYARGVLPGAPSWRRPQQQGRGRGLQQHCAVPCSLKAKAWPAASLRPLLLRAHPQALRCT